MTGDGLPSLTALDLSHNEITTIPVVLALPLTPPLAAHLCASVADRGAPRVSGGLESVAQSDHHGAH